MRLPYIVFSFLILYAHPFAGCPMLLIKNSEDKGIIIDYRKGFTSSVFFVSRFDGVHKKIDLSLAIRDMTNYSILVQRCPLCVAQRQNIACFNIF